MSTEKAQKITEKPKPPSIEDILADLKEGAADDVAFQSPSCLKILTAADGSQAGSKTPPQQENKEHASNLPSSNDTQTSKKSEEVWTSILDFLTAYTSLETSKSTLGTLLNDITEKQSQLETAANELKDSWESGNTEEPDLT